MKKSRQRAFTIIEIVIVIAVIAVLSAILIPTFSSIIQQANDTRAESELRDIKIKLEMAFAKENPIAYEVSLQGATPAMIEIKIHRNSDGTLWAENDGNNLGTALNDWPELDGYGGFTVEGKDLIYTTKNGEGKATWSNIVGEKPTAQEPNNPTTTAPHDHSFIDGKCSCGEFESASTNLSFDLVGGNAYYVTGIGECTDTNIIIPKFYNEKPVTRIRAGAFSNYTELESVVIPDSVETIGDSAFLNCINLTDVEIPNSVMIIGSNAFEGCTSFERIDIPESVNIISDYAFSNCTNLKTINFSEGLNSIGGSTFEYCTSLEKVKLPQSLTYIGISAFSYCSNLTNITMGDAVTYIGSSAFINCDGLTYIKIPNSVTIIQRQTFYSCSSLKKVVIPESVTTIDAYAFSSCTELTTIEYKGTSTMWRRIKFEHDWDTNINGYRIEYSDKTIE